MYMYVCVSYVLYHVFLKMACVHLVLVAVTRVCQHGYLLGMNIPAKPQSKLGIMHSQFIYV